MNLGSFEDGHKVFVLLVSALLHFFVVSHALLDFSAKKSQLRQLLCDAVRSLHLLQVGDPSVKDRNSCLQTLLSSGILCTMSLCHAKLVVNLCDRPGVRRQSLGPLRKTESQILHSLLEVRILQAHLSQEGQRLTLLGNIASLAVDHLGEIKHLPGLRQVTSLSINLLSVRLHLVTVLLPLHDIVLFRIFLSVVTDVCSGHEIMLLKVLFESISNLLLDLRFFISVITSV